jgi:hypothetical protein
MLRAMCEQLLEGFELLLFIPARVDLTEQEIGRGLRRTQSIVNAQQ